MNHFMKFMLFTIMVIGPTLVSAQYSAIHNETHNLQLKEDGRLIKVVRITTTAELDRNNKVLRFTFFTDNYDKQDWTRKEKRVPIFARHTKVAPQYMGIIILHPNNVEVLDTRQQAYHVSERKGYKWVALSSYEENKKAQIATEVSEELINYLLSYIPFGNVGYKQLVKQMKKRDEQYYGSIFPERVEYTTTSIPLHHSRKLIGYTETARSIEIPFNTSGQGNNEISFWINPAFGDPSLRSLQGGTFPLGFGRLEGVVVKFSLR